ncbi:putative disease resistance RPP13-like protein 3 [Carex rostrata]
MAEAIVSVLSKLAVVIVNEAQFLGGVGKKIKGVQRELTRIKCCLQDADSKRKGDERVQNWLNELRNVAYRIEDATDTFFLHVGYTDARFSQKLKKLCSKPKELYFRHKLGNELDDIQNLLEEISKSRLTYGIRDLPVEDKSKGEANVIMPHRRTTYQEVDETEVVGMQADKNKILELLRRDPTRTRRAVITIVGPGGLGKTTLAHMVYKSARADFDYHIMLSISQQFSVTDLLKKMLPKDSTRENQTVENETVGDLINKVKSFLSTKRYLIILDDVWEDDLWNQLKDALPDDNNGSRVLMTSRIIDVATSADSQMNPYELKYLNDSESLDLLLKKALPYQEPTQKCPNDLHELAEKLSKKCKGLPLGLVVLGGILSTKGPSYTAWERVLETINWHLDSKDCMPILAMSYEDMPYYLKACFQYLAIFPEDHVICAKRLIRMWIAEGFIPLEGRPTIEIMAEYCLEELSKRSMVQVLSRNVNGLIKHIKVHDFIRDLAINEARHENTVTVFSQASADNKPDRIIRRASLQAEEKNLQFIEYVGPNTRSLFLFDTDGYFERSLHCTNFRLLKVLEIVGSTHKRYLVIKSLDELIHLKYLGLTECNIKRASFHGMKSLETLELRGRGYDKFDGLWTISTLRHVLVEYPEDIQPIPKGTTISNLQTLKWWVRLQDVCDAKLPNLRTLGIENYSGKWVSSTNLFQTLRNLRKYCIDCYEYSKIPIEIVYPKALPNYQNLQSIYLKGEWPENVNVEASLLPPLLIKLTLRGSLLNQNPMRELGKLNSLKKLCLDDALTYNWVGPIICPEGFRALQYLKVTDKNIKDLTVEEGVMPKLTYLQVDTRIKVNLPPELHHVAVERV